MKFVHVLRVIEGIFNIEGYGIDGIEQCTNALTQALVFIHGFNCDLATALGRVVGCPSLGVNMLRHCMSASLFHTEVPLKGM